MPILSVHNVHNIQLKLFSSIAAFRMGFLPGFKAQKSNISFLAAVRNLMLNLG